MKQKKPQVCLKIKYSSPSLAKKMLRLQKKCNARVERVYYCQECRAWHLTSERAESHQDPTKYRKRGRRVKFTSADMNCMESGNFSHLTVRGDYDYL
jgi:hypothetical protein